MEQRYTLEMKDIHEAVELLLRDKNPTAFIGKEGLEVTVRHIRGVDRTYIEARLY